MSIIGRPAPTWSGSAAKEGEQIKLSSADLKGKWYVLFFYPLDFTFVCPTEIVAFDDLHDKFKAAGCEVIGCSVDSVHTHLAYMRTPRTQAGVGELKFPLLSDLSKSITAAFDVMHPDGDKALRATFVVDPDGVVQSAVINNLSIGRNVEETLRTVKAAQYTRVHGDVCPANWHEGEEGMKATLDGVKGVIGSAH
jgi:peroxiredoxin (alkyl hydroperoxide reductase subunit C)